MTKSSDTNPNIRILPEELCRLIAAGEVVSRPLDVVRELVDNALDAKSTRIELTLQNGGLEQISLRDNGQGIAADMLKLAMQRHATNKLEWREDALEHVQTLGFRGEALWAIAQAGELRLQSRPAAQLGACQLVAFENKHTISRLSAPAGTLAEVHKLFAHLPARLHTQLPAATEVREIIMLLGRYILHYPNLHWRLISDSETKINHAASPTRGAVASIYGSLSANRMLEISGKYKFWHISGLISRPELSRSRRDRMHFAINGRPIAAPAQLEKAVIAGYGELLSLGNAPLCVINIQLPPHLHNPNIHPSKETVGLAQLEQLCQQVQQAVNDGLSKQTLAPAVVVPEIKPETNAELLKDSNSNSNFPQMRLLAVYQELYLLAEAEGDLWLIDGHAAHERIWYERLDRQWQGKSYQLPEPELIQLTPSQQANLQARNTQLQQLGLELEEFGAGLARLRSIPAALAQLPIPQLHQQLLDDLLGDIGGDSDPQRVVLGKLACAPALKAGMLNKNNGEAILQQLALCQQPWACPHGRPTTLRLSERDLAHAFGRRGVRDVARGRDTR